MANAARHSQSSSPTPGSTAVECGNGSWRGGRGPGARRRGAPPRGPRRTGAGGGREARGAGAEDVGVLRTLQRREREGERGAPQPVVVADARLDGRGVRQRLVAVDREAVVDEQRRLQQGTRKTGAVAALEAQQRELAPTGHGLEPIHLE